MSEPSAAAMRREYMLRGLTEAELDPDPIAQFRVWFADALAANLPEPNAMTLATADAAGHPSARMVLLKGFDDRGFLLYTNYESRKGEQLAANPWAALVLYWAELERQVRIEGRVERASAAESDTYFASRPRGSQLGAWASRQDAVLPGRAPLEQRLAALEAEYGEREVPRPPYWGGYRVSPRSIEFWQGRPSRLHDRLRYRRAEDEKAGSWPGSWHIERLSP